MRRFPLLPRFVLASLATALLAHPARALDKQGRARSADDGTGDGFDVAGTLSLGPALYNPGYAARPDNTGKTLMRYALHLDVDLIGSKLSLPFDVNTFTDRERSGLKKLSPSELDVIGGVASAWDVGPGSFDIGSHVEQDRALDRAPHAQTYVDARSRYSCAASALWPSMKQNRAAPEVSGAFTLGWFIYNPSYFARPDNTGKALLRYNPHVDVSILDGFFALGLDATLFTDRQESVFRPSELDFTPDLGVHFDRYEAHLAYERDMPLDRGGLVQQFVYALFVIGFDAAKDF